MATIKKEEAKTEIMEVSNPYDEEMVKIKLFKDNDKYKDDVTVGRNGYFYRIQRGIEVKVPKGIAEILENQERMDNAAQEAIAAAQERAEKV